MEEEHKKIGRLLAQAAYETYGTHSGVIFGIPAECRGAVEMVVADAIEYIDSMATEIFGSGEMGELSDWKILKENLLRRADEMVEMMKERDCLPAHWEVE